MIVDGDSDTAHNKLQPGYFLIDLHRTATFVFTRGAPFFVISHFRFLIAYIANWRDQKGEEALDEALEDLKKTGEEGSIMARLLSTRRLSLGAKALAVISALALDLVIELPTQFFLAVTSSAWQALQQGVRSAPPLITAVVVVFVTSDAWRILGTGFTLRFFALVGVFMLASLLFLIRFKDYWDYDIAIGGPARGVDAATDQTYLLKGIRHAMKGDEEADDHVHGNTQGETDLRRDGVPVSLWQEFQQLMDYGAAPTPLVKPARRGGRASVYGGYVALCALSLIVLALFVSCALVIVGLILINAKETGVLAQSAHVYLTLPGNLVVTRQLVTLSLSLGAFSAFFLVAAQHTEDRTAFMNKVLVRLRRALLVYSVYCRAHDRATDWTDVPVESTPLAYRTH